MSNAKHKSPENAFHDLSQNSSVFRQKLIQEFQVIDNMSDMSKVGAPIFNSREFSDLKIREKIMVDNPFQLIKFPTYKRTAASDDDGDRRCNRTRYIDSLPVGVWAATLIQHNLFRYGILSLIILNGILMGVDAELQSQMPTSWMYFEFSRLFNVVVIFILYFESALRVLDNPLVFFKNGWEFAELVFIVISTIPEIYNSNPYIRILRLARIFRLMIASSTSRTILTTIFHAFKSMTNIMIFVFISGYICSMIGVELFQDYSRSTSQTLLYRSYFKNIGNTFKTLFQLLTLDQWDLINRSVQTVTDSAWTNIYIIFWVWLGAFIFRGIFVGVMVQNFDRIAASIKLQKNTVENDKRLAKMKNKLTEEIELENKVKKSVNDLRSTAEDLRSSQNLQSSSNDVVNSKSATEQIENMLENIQSLIKQTHETPKNWERTISETLTELNKNRNEILWPRDSLFKYFQLMESLQENMKEYEELLKLASQALLEIHDT